MTTAGDPTDPTPRRRALPRVSTALGLAAALLALSAPVTESIPAAVAAPAGPIRILPLGDSITYGYEHGSYRTALWHELVEQDGLDIDFVGSRQDGPDALPDRDHEGHSGLRIDEIESRAAGCVLQHDPDIVLLHIGTNDMIQGASAEVMTERLDTLLGTLFRAGPDMTVIAASVIPLHERDERESTYNAAVERLVTEYRGEGRDARFADIGGADIEGRDDIPDGVHPGQQGYAKMAAVWYPVVRAALDAPRS